MGSLEGQPGDHAVGLGDHVLDLNVQIRERRRQYLVQPLGLIPGLVYPELRQPVCSCAMGVTRAPT
jgi:hypothetical protein